MSISLTRQAAIAASIVALGSAMAGFAPASALRPAKADVIAAAADAPRGDRADAPTACSLATWPYLPAECLTSRSGEPVPPAQWITVEARFGANASALTSQPAH